MKKISTLLFFSITLLFSSASMAQSSDFWVGQWDLTFTDPADTEALLNPAILTIDLEDDNLVGELVYFAQDGSEFESFVIDHFNDSDTELILGFKSGSDERYFTLTLRIEDDETLSGTITDNSENFLDNVIAKRSESDDSSKDVPQSGPWVGEWDLIYIDPNTQENLNTGSLIIGLEDDSLTGYIRFEHSDGSSSSGWGGDVFSIYLNEENELTIIFKAKQVDRLYLASFDELETDHHSLRLQIGTDENLYGICSKVNGENAVYNVKGRKTD